MPDDITETVIVIPRYYEKISRYNKDGFVEHISPPSPIRYPSCSSYRQDDGQMVRKCVHNLTIVERTLQMIFRSYSWLIKQQQLLLWLERTTGLYMMELRLKPPLQIWPAQTILFILLLVQNIVKLHCFLIICRTTWIQKIFFIGLDATEIERWDSELKQWVPVYDAGYSVFDKKGMLATTVNLDSENCPIY